jgi:addiction module HigA family antidote
MSTDAATTVAPVHPPIHPGEILADELAEIGVSQSELARALGVPRSRISDIIRGVRPITADTGLRLSRYFGTSDRFWINLQADYDTQVALDQYADELARVQPRRAS